MASHPLKDGSAKAGLLNPGDGGGWKWWWECFFDGFDFLGEVGSKLAERQDGKEVLKFWREKV